MDIIIDSINNNRGLIAVIALILSSSIKLSGIVLSNQRKKLSYFIGKEKSNEGTTYSNIIIWNDGRGVIRKEDIPTKGKIKIKIESGLITKLEKLNQTSEYISIKKIEKGEKEAKVEFDFLEPYDGIVYKINHTPSAKFIINGKVIGGKEIQKSNPKTGYKRYRIINMISKGLILIALYFGSLFIPAKLGWSGSYGEPGVGKSLLLVYTLFILAGIVIFTVPFKIKKIFEFGQKYIEY